MEEERIIGVCVHVTLQKWNAHETKKMRTTEFTAGKY
jgi:hypothetical protein